MTPDAAFAFRAWSGIPRLAAPIVWVRVPFRWLEQSLRAICVEAFAQCGRERPGASYEFSPFSPWPGDGHACALVMWPSAPSTRSPYAVERENLSSYARDHGQTAPLALGQDMISLQSRASIFRPGSDGEREGDAEAIMLMRRSDVYELALSGSGRGAQITTLTRKAS